MELVGERIIEANRAQVWAALNDPDVLRACIPGCETLTKEGADGFSATVSLKVGPVKARMEGDVQLHDIDPPNSYRIAGKGKGAAGFASGEARVNLTDCEAGTHLGYTVTAKIGGKLAEVGARFIDSTAEKMAGQFFDSFAKMASNTDPAPASAAVPEVTPAASTGWLKYGIAAAAIIALILIYTLIA